MHYYKHHIGDYDSATAHLTWSEDMAYTRILRLYYRNDGVLPACEKAVCRLIRATSKEERLAVDTVLNEFFVKTESGWKNKRADKEIEAYQARAEKNREHGKKGGRPRKTETKIVSGENQNGFEQETQMVSEKKPTKNQEPLTINQEPLTNLESNPPSADADRKRNGCRLPDDWMPDVVFAVGAGMSELDALTESERFRDYWRSVAGAKGRKSDWHATWRNWVRRAVESKPPFKPNNPTPHGGSFAERHTDQSWRVGL